MSTPTTPPQDRLTMATTTVRLQARLLYLASMTGRELARLAGCPTPGGTTTPGSVFLTSLAAKTVDMLEHEIRSGGHATVSAMVDHIRLSGGVDQLAHAAPNMSTRTMWHEYADLANPWPEGYDPVAHASVYLAVRDVLRGIAMRMVEAVMDVIKSDAEGATRVPPDTPEDLVPALIIEYLRCFWATASVRVLTPTSVATLVAMSHMLNAAGVLPDEQGDMSDVAWVVVVALHAVGYPTMVDRVLDLPEGKEMLKYLASYLGNFTK